MNQWRYRVYFELGDIVCTSENFPDESDANQWIHNVDLENISDYHEIEIMDDEGQWIGLDEYVPGTPYSQLTASQMQGMYEAMVDSQMEEYFSPDN